MNISIKSSELLQNKIIHIQNKNSFIYNPYAFLSIGASRWQESEIFNFIFVTLTQKTVFVDLVRSCHATVRYGHENSYFARILSI